MKAIKSFTISILIHVPLCDTRSLFMAHYDFTRQKRHLSEIPTPNRESAYRRKNDELAEPNGAITDSCRLEPPGFCRTE
jgi:hypothetical protein